ncbi:MAG: ECF transporter S component [Ruminococcaceae bacterium]|nr:ECF transporter S component [Oscillospiraceae bacterium]
MNSKLKPKELTLMGLLTAVLLVMSFTPIGFLTIGPLAITLNMIPVAIGAIALGPKGGAVLGAVFGITSFLQCIGIGGTSPMGVILFEINPALAFIQRFVPRLVMGLLTAYIYKIVKKSLGSTVANYVSGFSAAFLNTALFMGFLVLLFGNTEYMTELIGGKNIIVFICSFVGINAVFEMAVSTVLTGIIVKALEKARLIKRSVE